MRIIPKSLAGRLAVLLVLTLVVAQIATFALFSGERIAAFRGAYRDDLAARIVSLVTLLEQAPEEMHSELLTTASSRLFRVTIDTEPAIDSDEVDAPELRSEIARALGRANDEVRVAFWEHRGRERWEGGTDGDRHDRHSPPDWMTLSIGLADGRWLNAFVDRPPVPPMGKAFLVSFLISAAAVGLVGALGVRWASGPLRGLAAAAERLGRGENFEPLPEAGPHETRSANAAFNRMRERLDRFIRDRTTMLAAVAHDLRTPITSLRLRAEFIEEADVRQNILATVAEMQAMAEAVLAFARGDAAGETSRPTDITALVESVAEDAAEGGCDVTVEESPAVTLNVRPFALKRLVGNLIDNASFHGKRARVRVEAESTDIRIIVDDEGPGVPEGDLERVFDPFVRLESSRSRDTGGAGLGLSIARTIARAHGGDVVLENRTGGGLRAIISLPR